MWSRVKTQFIFCLSLLKPNSTSPHIWQSFKGTFLCDCIHYPCAQDVSISFCFSFVFNWHEPIEWWEKKKTNDKYFFLYYQHLTFISHCQFSMTMFFFMQFYPSFYTEQCEVAARSEHGSNILHNKVRQRDLCKNIFVFFPWGGLVQVCHVGCSKTLVTLESSLNDVCEYDECWTLFINECAFMRLVN